MTTPSSSPTDFDFLVGHWRVLHRRLRDRLAGSHEWIDFTGTTTLLKTLGGFGNMDDNVLDLPGGAYRAMTVRTYDATAGQWSIWWLDGRVPTTIGTRMVGCFDAGVGTFYADDTFAGKPIRVRFLWTVRADTPHWEQAFSGDDGVTWETNWVMDFTRA